MHVKLLGFSAEQQPDSTRVFAVGSLSPHGCFSAWSYTDTELIFSLYFSLLSLPTEVSAALSSHTSQELTS